MSKKELVRMISEEIGETQAKSSEIVQKTLESIVETLVLEGRIELRDFGIFEIKRRESRRGRNPKTGDLIEVPAKYVVSFKPGKNLEEKLRQMDERDRIMEAHRRSKNAGNQPSSQKSDSSPSSGDDHSSKQ